MLAPAAIEKIREQTFVAEIEYHLELGSTNDLALELVQRDDYATPLLVLAENQTAGRGRGSNRWWGGEGALTFSLLLEPAAASLPKQASPRVSLATGLAVQKGLAELLPDADIGLKWPNDVYLGYRKVAGILVEVPPSRPERLVIGIGINVNNSFLVAPVGPRAIATSLFDATGSHFDLADVLIHVLKQTAACLERLASADARLFEEWQSLCLLKGHPVRIESGSRQLVGICRGIDQEGALLLDTEAGVERAFGGVVTRIEPEGGAG